MLLQGVMRRVTDQDAGCLLIFMCAHRCTQPKESKLLKSQDHLTACRCPKVLSSSQNLLFEKTNETDASLANQKSDNSTGLV